MTALSSVLKPRKSVFDQNQRDTVLDLTDLAQGKVDAKTFFAENFVTQGMRQLYEAVFKRLEGHEDDGVFKLTEAMGGGKTHNMIAVGLMAQNPDLRKGMDDVYKTKLKGAAKVISFSGREQPPFGIWGALAEQLGKKELMNDFYSPLKAPGQSQWIALLQGEPTLILVDELPPYFQQASTIPVGQGNLADVTTQALSNLLVALGKEELKNVALVLSDLSGSYQRGTGIIADVFSDFERETRRTSKEFIPVRQNSDELYHILRKKLFEKEPDAKVAEEVAKQYADEVKRANQMDLTNESPDAFQKGIRDTYPFHPSISNLYARFKENPGFMQTRGLIRLMRSVVARMWDKDHGWASRSLLIHPYDVDPNDSDTLTQLNNINSSLTNAIANDIAAGGQAAAEKYATELGNELPVRTARLLLMSSLGSVQNSVKGLKEGELVAYLAAPGVALESLKHKVLPDLRERSWYLHSDNQGHYLYKNIQNISAKVNQYKQNVNRERARQAIIKQLQELFEPKQKDCYQKLYVLAPVDEIEIVRDQVALVIHEPHGTSGLNPDLKALYDNQTYKNRVCFLSGDLPTMDNVYEAVRSILAVDSAIQDFEREHMAKNDPQFQEAHELKDRFRLQFFSAIQNVFVKLYYPTTVGMSEANLSLQFKANQYNGEEQVRNLLLEKKKFVTETTTDSFVAQAEAKLFGNQKKLPWTDIGKNAALTISWPWHHPKALDNMRDQQVSRGQWKVEGNWIEKGPFELPPTSVSVQLVERDDATGKARLRIKPLNGDKVHYQYGGKVDTNCANWEVQNIFETTDMEVEFLCVDSEGKHKTGEALRWTNSITLQHQFVAQEDEYLCTLQAGPPSAEIRYTTDGSEPLKKGAVYGAPFLVKPGTIVSVIATKGEHRSELRHYTAPAAAKQETRIDTKKPATWRKSVKRDITSGAFELVSVLRKTEATVRNLEVAVYAGDQWAKLDTDDKTPYSADQVEEYLCFIQDHTGITGELSLTIRQLSFPTGQHLLDAAKAMDLKPDPKDVDQ